MAQIILLALACIGILSILWPLFSRRMQTGDTMGVALIRDQLREVEEDLKQERITQREAEGARSELKRRVIRISQRQDQSLKPGRNGYVLITISLLAIPLSGFWLYQQLGAPGFFDTAENEERQQLSDMQASARNLRLKLQMEGGPVNEWLLLARSLDQFGARSESLRTLEQARRQFPDSDLDLLMAEVLLRRGSPDDLVKASALLENLKRKSPMDVRPAYLMGFVEQQRGRPEKAFDVWMELWEKSPPDAPWSPHLRRDLQMLASQLNRDISDLVPQEAPMSSDDELNMIQGMVSGLAQRLEENPQDLEGWAMLFRSYAVLGNVKALREAYERASHHFQNNPDGLIAVQQSARDAGLKIGP